MDDEKEANYSFLHTFMKNKLFIGGLDSSDCPPIVTVNVKRYCPSILRTDWYEYLWLIYKNKLTSINNIRLVKVHICLIIARKKNDIGLNLQCIWFVDIDTPQPSGSETWYTDVKKNQKNYITMSQYWYTINLANCGFGNCMKIGFYYSQKMRSW